MLTEINAAYGKHRPWGKKFTEQAELCDKLYDLSELLDLQITK